MASKQLLDSGIKCWRFSFEKRKNIYIYICIYIYIVYTFFVIYVYIYISWTGVLSINQQRKPSDRKKKTDEMVHVQTKSYEAVDIANTCKYGVNIPE